MNKSEQVQTYLKQQSELFGGELFLKDSESSKSSFNSSSENKVSANKISQLYKSISIDKKSKFLGIFVFLSVLSKLFSPVKFINLLILIISLCGKF